MSWACEVMWIMRDNGTFFLQLCFMDHSSKFPCTYSTC